MSRGTDASFREPLSGRKLKERALDLLGRRDHSCLELSQKLVLKGGRRDEIDPLIEELKGWGYLDDRRFAENFVRYRAGKAWGRHRYRQELAKRGVDAEIIAIVLSELPELAPDKMLEKLEELVEREQRKGKAPEKIMASLSRRGFAPAAIRSVLKTED